MFGTTERKPRQRITGTLRQKGGYSNRCGANQERPRQEWIELAVAALISETADANGKVTGHNHYFVIRLRPCKRQQRADIVFIRGMQSRDIANPHTPRFQQTLPTPRKPVTPQPHRQ